MDSQRVNLEAIVFDAGTQVRAAISEQTVADYAEAMSEGVAFPAIVLFHDGNRYYLADGFHRAMASKRVGYVDIDARVEAGTQADALWYALGANKANGHRMTLADKKHAIVLAIQTWPDRSMHQIAEQIGCTYQYVQQEKAKVASTCHLPERVTGKDGKSYPATRRNMPRESTTAAPVAASPEPPAFKSRAAVEERRERMRAMASEGYSSVQIAATVGLSEENVRVTLRAEGVDVPADRVTRGTHRHDSNRILEHIVADAETLTADVKLIDFDALDSERLGAWIDSLRASRRALGSFIDRLIKEQQKHGEAA